MQVFIVHPINTNIRCIVTAFDREGAKRNALEWIGNGYGGGPDQWEVTPLTNPGDRVRLNITLSV